MSGSAGIVLLVVGGARVSPAPRVAGGGRAVHRVRVGDLAGRAGGRRGWADSAGAARRSTLPAVSGSDFDTLVSLALACFLLSYVESMAVARTFAAKHGDEIDPNQELLALGVANAAVAFGHGYPVSGGMSQSAVNDASGARTPAAILVVAALIAVVLVFLTGLFRNLPSPDSWPRWCSWPRAGLIDLGALGRMRRASPPEYRIALLAADQRAGPRDAPGVVRRGHRVGRDADRARGAPAHGRPRPRPGHGPVSAIMAHAPHNEEIPDVLVFRVDGAIFFANASSVRNAATAAVERAGRPIKLVVFTLEGASAGRSGGGGHARGSPRPARAGAASACGWCMRATRCGG